MRERRDLNAAKKSLKARGAELRDQTWIVDVDASDNYRGCRRNASPCMLASRGKGFWCTSRERRPNLGEASRLQGLKPLSSRDIPDSKLFSMLGNAMTAPVIKELLRGALTSLGVE